MCRMSTKEGLLNQWQLKGRYKGPPTVIMLQTIIAIFDQETQTQTQK